MNLFQTKKAAQDFIVVEAKDYYRVQTEVQYLFPKDIKISQEHFTFFCFNQNINYNFLILENSKGFEVTCESKKYSALVLAAENGDLELFKMEYSRGHSGRALSLAFKYAIMDDKLNILQFYFDADIVKELTLFDEPMITAVEGDRINSFLFFLRKGMQLPKDILGPLFHYDSIQILNHIIEDAVLSKEILEDKFQTNWAIKGLRKKDNRCTKLFKNHFDARR